jgi:hypothetical protein
MKELIEAYDEYIALLEKAEASMFGLAHAHGYRCPDKLVKKGQELRAKISDLKSSALGQRREDGK